MKSIVILPSFERSLKKLSVLERKQAAESLEAFNAMLITGRCPAGLGFKKINHDKYELRVTIKSLDKAYVMWYVLYGGDLNDYVKRHASERAAL